MQKDPPSCKVQEIALQRLNPTKRTSGRFLTEPRRNLPVVAEVDILVAGGGMAGLTAAITAGRMGLRTLLVEYFGHLGGNATNGLVSGFCGFYTRTENTVPIVQGIGGEIVRTLIDREAGIKVRPRTLTDVDILTDPEMLKLIFDEKAIEAKVEPLYYTQAVSPIIQNDIVKGAIVENKGGRQAILAKRVLDCTGDGDLCARANVPFELGDGRGGFQASDMVFRLVNVAKGDIDPKELEGLQAEAINSGQYKLTRIGGGLEYNMISGVYGVQMARLPSAVNGIDPYQLTRAIIQGRKLVRECTRFLVGKVTGLEQAAIVQTNEKLAIRETRRVLGEHILTAEEILNGTKFDDGIGANAWPVEIHTPGTLETRVLSLKGDGFCTIPYRCLIPQKIENLLMAGRFISCTHEAQSSIRVMGPASVMGQAIATAAALSIKEKVSPRKLKIRLLQSELEKAGVFLG